MKTAIDLIEKGLVPDALMRWGIRKLLVSRLDEEKRRPHGEEFVNSLRNSPLAPVPEKANEQHYELPPEFFTLVLGKHLKYSSCFWTPEINSLDEAEEAMLLLTCERAGLEDGMDILELGCGWGSLSLWMAEHYPNSRILAVSNSAPQKRFIDEQRGIRNLLNLEIQTCDMNVFDTNRRFDRVVSVEMFEHMRNYEALLSQVSRWLKSDGKLFVHIFCHREYAYPFETEGDDNWMGRYFFTGGIMPSENLFNQFNRDLKVARRWRVDGTHYQKTSEAWLQKLDGSRSAALRVLAQNYGEAEAERWFNRWRMFFIACAELFGYRNGREWMVSHYLFDRARQQSSRAPQSRLSGKTA